VTAEAVLHAEAPRQADAGTEAPPAAAGAAEAPGRVLSEILALLRASAMRASRMRRIA